VNHAAIDESEQSDKILQLTIDKHIADGVFLSIVTPREAMFEIVTLSGSNPRHRSSLRCRSRRMSAVWMKYSLQQVSVVLIHSRLSSVATCHGSSAVPLPVSAARRRPPERKNVNTKVIKKLCAWVPPEPVCCFSCQSIDVISCLSSFFSHIRAGIFSIDGRPRVDNVSP
jgi:hypothetical protein